MAWDGIERRQSGAERRGMMGQQHANEVNPECASRLATLEALAASAAEDLRNNSKWRGEMAVKLDAIHDRITTNDAKASMRITGLETRLYLILGGIGVLVWVFEHGFKL